MRIYFGSQKLPVVQTKKLLLNGIKYKQAERKIAFNFRNKVNISQEISGRYNFGFR